MTNRSLMTRGCSLIAVTLFVAMGGTGRAQTPVAPISAPVVELVKSETTLPAKPEVATGVIQASCPGCGVSSLAPSSPGVWGSGHHHSGGGCDSCGLLCDGGGCGSCGEGSCIPGRAPCVSCEGQSRLGRVFCAFHNALCCPDPCYEPRWIDAANSAIFVDSARPWTMTRLRYNASRNIINANRGEFFQAAPAGTGRGPAPLLNVNADTVSFYQEVSSGAFSAIIDTPYRSVSQGAGFGDLGIGTKTLLLDSELITSSFQFMTYIPVGNVGNGVGTGHVTLDPSMLGSLKLFTETYLQTQLGLAIPIGGSSAQSNVLHYQASFNHVLCRPLADTAIIANMEFAGYSFFGGSIVNAAGTTLSGNGTIFTLGPTIRMAICNKIDVGFGTQFATSDTRLAEQQYVTEVRWRY